MDRRRISGQICPLEYQAFHSRNNYAARPLKNRWSNEELMLATGTGGLTRLRHDLKLCNAYLGVLVRFLSHSYISLHASGSFFLPSLTRIYLISLSYELNLHVF
ncbi:unnamed protein product [Camellia sinensis]